MTESSELNSLGNKERLRLPEWLAKALAEGSLDPKNLPPVVVAMLAENGALGADLEEEPPLSAEEVAIVAEAGLPAQTEEAVAVAEAPLEAESLEPVAEVAAMAAVAAPEMEPAPELESAPPVEEAPQPEAEPEPQPEVVAEPQPQPEVVSETKLEPPAEVAPQPEAAAEPQGEEVAPSEEFPPQQEESGPPEVTSEPQAEAVSEPEPPAEAVPEVKPEQQPQVAPQPEVAAEPPAVETPAPPVAKVAAEEDDDPLLGAPKRVEEAEGDEFCTPSAPPVEEAPSPHELQEREAALQARRLEDIRAQVAANLEAAPQEAANVEEGADKRQAELQQLEEMAARFDFPGKLIDRGHFIQLRPLYGDVLYPSKPLFPFVSRSQKNPVAEHKGVFRLHPERMTDPVNGFFHPKDLRPVFQQDMSRFHGSVQNFPLVCIRLPASFFLPHSPAPYASFV